MHCHFPVTVDLPFITIQEVDRAGLFSFDGGEACALEHTVPARGPEPKLTPAAAGDKSSLCSAHDFHHFPLSSPYCFR